MKQSFFCIKQIFPLMLLLMIIESFASLTAAECSMEPLSLNGEWLIATDANNSGRDQKWFQAPIVDVQLIQVPGVLQDKFPEYNGIVWYWKEFVAPKNNVPNGRYLLHFTQVDYYAEIWLNGEFIGSHEGGETPFTIDATEFVSEEKSNLLAVRVLNPTLEKIDNIVLNQIPKRCKNIPFMCGGILNYGGITGAVQLQPVPSIYIEDLFIDARPQDGTVRTEVTLVNSTQKELSGTLEFNIASGRNGNTIQITRQTVTVPVGRFSIRLQNKIKNPLLWELNEPNLYRGTARFSLNSSETQDSSTFSECSQRFGFRQFRFHNGYFELNGKRLFLKSAHTVNNFPIGLHIPHDPDLWRRDLLNLKAMGFNMVRFIWGGTYAEQLDYCDEIGLMVYDENFAAHDIADSPWLKERFQNNVCGVVRRDRNHPSVVIWGLLNEVTGIAPVFPLAVEMLPLLRELDTSRMVMLNSGRWDLNQGTGLAEEIHVWTPPGKQIPCVGKNKTDRTVETLNIHWLANHVGLHPGDQDEYADVRWTAPESGTYRLTATFAGLSDKTTTDVHIYHQNTALFDGEINIGQGGNSCSFECETLTVEKGDRIDFLVGSGGNGIGSDTTGLQATLEGNGKKYDLSSDYSEKINPSEYWTYGSLAADQPFDFNSFTCFGSQMETQTSVLMPGTLSNPDSDIWENLVHDTHPYKAVPHTSDIIRQLRTASGNAIEQGTPLYLSEYGIGSIIDVIRTMRFYEQFGGEKAIDAQIYQTMLDSFETDWEKWKLGDTFDRPEDFFTQGITKMAQQRILGIDAIRSNPNIVGHNVTGVIDVMALGEGLTTPFREHKPGTMDAFYELWAPLRWSVFVDPVHIYRGQSVHLEAILSNEDVLKTGQYPVKIEVFGPSGQKFLDKKIMIDVPQTTESTQTSVPFAQQYFDDHLILDGPTGKYRFVVTFEKGAAATGGEFDFWVTDRNEMPKIDAEVVLWNDDPNFTQWLKEHEIPVRSFNAETVNKNDVILVTTSLQSKNADVTQLEQLISNGATVIFLSPSALIEANENQRDLFLKGKGHFAGTWSWLYLKDEWAKEHPFFEGLPAGGLMDSNYYWELIPFGLWFVDEKGADQPVAGAIKATQGYSSGLHLAVYRHGKGQIVLNTFLILDLLERNPVAERLLRNMIRHCLTQN